MLSFSFLLADPEGSLTAQPRRTAEPLRLSPDELGACSAGRGQREGARPAGVSRRGGAVTARGRGARRGGRRIVRGGGGGAAMERWTGRVALVTGASVGIGAAVARALVQHGMKVVGCARSVDKIEVPGRGRGVRLREGRGGSLGPGGAIGGSAPSPQRLRARSGRAAPRGPACAGGTGRGGGSALGAVPRRGWGCGGSRCGAIGAVRTAGPVLFREPRLSGRAHPAGSGPGRGAFKDTRSGARRVSRASLTLKDFGP